MTYIQMEELPELDMAALPDYPAGFMKPYATKAGRDVLWEWHLKRVEVTHEDGSREMDYAYLHEPLPTPFSIRINVATYANISFPGIGVPLYL